MPQASSAARIGSRGPMKAVRAALIHQRIGPERRRHLRAARLAHQFDMRDVGRAVGPLIGARQRRCAVVRVERRGAVGACLVQEIVDVLRAAAQYSRQSSIARCSVGAMCGTRRIVRQIARRRRPACRRGHACSDASFISFSSCRRSPCLPPLRRLRRYPADRARRSSRRLRRSWSWRPWRRPRRLWDAGHA